MPQLQTGPVQDAIAAFKSASPEAFNPSDTDGRRVVVVNAKGKQRKLVGKEATLVQTKHFTYRDFVLLLKFDDGSTAWMDKIEFELVSKEVAT